MLQPVTPTNVASKGKGSEEERTICVHAEVEKRDQGSIDREAKAAKAG